MELLKIRVCTAATLLFLAVACSSEELTLSVNFRRPVSISNERFLSFTVDPETFLHSDGGLSKNFEKSIHIAQVFAPAYIRIGGPTSNSFELGKTLDPQANYNESNIFSESNWNHIHQWVERTGLDLIACLSPENLKASSDNARMKAILSLNDKMGYNTSWQLGYECQTRCNLSANELGARVANLRRMLDENPRYSSSIITGPDVISCETKQQQAYLQNYLSHAAPALSAITWHPDLHAMHMEGSSISMLHDNLAVDKENLYRSIGDFIGDRPLWIAESRKESEKDKFLGALAWANRLGIAAKLKVDVIMRQLSDLSSTNPDFWVSVLHKQLVGRKVFDIKIQSEYTAEVQFYCHCTKVSQLYESGSVTIFGLNLSPGHISVQIKNQKITTLHKYILSPGFDTDNKLLSKNVLLNNEKISLLNNTYVPSIKPEILVDRRGLNLDLSPNAIGFWVLPELKIRSCMEEHANERAARTRAGKSRINTGLLEDDDVDITQTGSLEIRKTLVKRRTKQRNFHDDEKIRRKLTRRDVRRELNRLKKFLKKKLEYYQEKNTQMSEQVSETTQDKVDEEESIESRLRVHKERLLALQNSLQESSDTSITESVNRDVLSKSLELIKKIERNFENMRTRFGDTRRMTPRVKDRLRSLYELLKRTSPQEQEVNDSSESGKEESLRRSRRDLDGSADQLTTRKDAAKARSRMEQLRERRNDRKLKRKDDIRREVQPSPLEHRATDSGENNFYGFFRRAPAKDFPQGDVFLSTGDSAQNNDYDYVRDEDYSAGSKEEGSVDQRVTRQNGDQVQPQEDTWVDEENDYHSYAPNEFFENIKLNNYPAKKTVTGNAELSEAEQVEQEGEHPENESSQDHSEEELLNEEDARSTRQYGNQRNPNYSESFGQGAISNLRSPIRTRQAQNPKSVFFTQHGSLLKNARARLANQPRSILGRRIEAISGRNQHSDNIEFPAGAYDNTQHKRPKRKDDLTSLLDEEMIKEDERNSKDCRCRVIRKSGEDSKLLCRKRRNTEQSGTNPKDSLIQETPVGLIVPVPLEALEPKTEDVEVLEPEVLTTQTHEPSIESVPVIVPEQLVSDGEAVSETPAASLQEAVETIEESSTPIADDTTNVPNYPIELSTADNLENPRNARQLSEVPLVTVSPPMETLLDKNTGLLTDEANLHDETQFFRETAPDGAETTGNPIETVSGSIAYVPEHDASTRSPNLEEEAKPSIPQGFEGRGHESRSSTTEFTIRDEKPEAELTAGQSENDNKDTSTTGTLKREARLDETTPLGFAGGSSDRSNEKTVGSVNDVNKKAAHPKHSSRGKQRENEKAEETAKAREARLMARAKAILALRKENDSRKSKRIMQIPARSSSQENAQTLERQKKRSEQIERLRSKLREKREKMLEQYEREILDIVDKIDDEEKKNVKRREALERLGGSDDFKSMIDREKLAYVLMYNPDKYSLIKRDTLNNRPDSIEFITNDDIVGSKGEYERSRAARSGRYYDDSRLTDYSSSYSKSEKRRPSNFRKEEDRVKSSKYSSSNRKDSGMYYAIIESLSDPYYHRQTSHDHRKGYTEEKLPLNCRNGQCFDYPSKYYAKSRTSNDDDDSADDDRNVKGNRPSSGRKLYIIDPSTYRGGEPTLQLHESPFRSSKASSGKGDHLRKRSYTPRNHNSRKEKQEDSEGKKTTYLLGAPTSRDKVEKQNNGRLFGLLLNPVRRTNKRPDSTIPSISNRKSLREKQSSNRNAKNSTNIAGQVSEGENSEKKPSEKEPLTGTLVTSNAEEAKIQGEAGIQSSQDTQVNNDSKGTNTQKPTDETSVRRRRSTDSETKHRSLKRVAASTLRGKPIEKRRNQSYLCRKEDSDEASQEDPAVLYKLVKEDDHYKAVPTRNSGIRPRLLGRKRVESEVEEEREADKSVDDSDAIVGKSFDDYVRLMNLDENASYQSGEESGSSELLHIFLPSLAQNDYSPIQFLRGFGRHSDESYDSDEAHYAETLESQEDGPIELKKRSSDSSSKMKFRIEDSSDEFDRRSAEAISGKSTETKLGADYIGDPDYETNVEEMSQEYSDLEDAIVSDKYGILMVLPQKKKSHSRHRRDIGSGEQSEIAEHSEKITLPTSDEHELNSEHVTNRIDEPNESSPRKKNTTSYLEKKNLRKQYANKKVIWKNEAGENKDASFISKTVPKLEDVVVSGLQKAQNLTDSVEQLIDDIDQKFNETAITGDDYQNQKNGFPSAAHTAFHSMIINVKKFFTFLGGVTRILHG